MAKKYANNVLSKDAYRQMKNANKRSKKKK